MIQLRFARIEQTDVGCVTTFNDGKHVNSIPHDTHHYHVIAHRCGYGDDVLRYCVEHDFVHSFLAERLLGETSAALHSAAAYPNFYAATGCHASITPGQAAFEEMAVHAFQMWLRASVRPIISGIDWDALKADALALLDGQEAQR